MEKVDTKEVKGRTKRLSTLFQSYHPHAGKEGREYQVLCAELSNDKKFYVAHNKSYEQILVPKSADLLGKQFRVKIISTGKFHMMGEVVEGSLANAPALVTPLPYGSVSGGSVADPRRVEKLKAAEPVGASKDAATAVVTQTELALARPRPTCRRRCCRLTHGPAVLCIPPSLGWRDLGS